MGSHMLQRTHAGTSDYAESSAPLQLAVLNDACMSCLAQRVLEVCCEPLSAGRQPSIPAVLVQHSVGHALLETVRNVLLTAQMGAEQGAASGPAVARLTAAPYSSYEQLVTGQQGSASAPGQQQQQRQRSEEQGQGAEPVEGSPQEQQCSLPSAEPQLLQHKSKDRASNIGPQAAAGGPPGDGTIAGSAAGADASKVSGQHPQHGQAAGARQGSTTVPAQAQLGAAVAAPRLELLVPAQSQGFILEKVVSQQMDMSLVFREVLALLGAGGSQEGEEQQQPQQQGQAGQVEERTQQQPSEQCQEGQQQQQQQVPDSRLKGQD